MSNKETFYFSHDYNCREDEKIRELIFQNGMVGYGIYWAIVEMLYQNANAMRTNYSRIAFDLHQSTSAIIQSVIEDFGLFTLSDDKEFFHSESIKRRLEKRDEKSQKARESALNRWDKSKRNANASKPQCETDAIKERKGKENKVKDNILLEKEPKEKTVLEDPFETEQITNVPEERKKVAPKKEKFTPPSIQDVQNYCNERQNGIEAYTFINFYQSKGWKVGNQPMKDWKAAVRTWESKNKSNERTSNNQYNGHSANFGNTAGNKNGKISARTLLARDFDSRNEKQFSNGSSGNRTIDVEVVE